MSINQIDLQNDALIPVQQICKDRMGKRMSPATLWRWRTKGCDGVKLEAVKVGCTWFTTAAAFATFIQRQTEAATTAKHGPFEPQPRSDAMASRLRETGLL